MTFETLTSLDDFIPYNQRDVLTLKPLSAWTSEEKEIHIEHNRILQPGFATKEASKLIENAKLAGEQWLSDVCCPSVNAAIMLHISKEMVVNYQVNEENLGATCHKAYEAMLKKTPNMVEQQSEIINTKLQAEYKNGGALDDQVIEQRARERLVRNKADIPNIAALEAAKEIERDLVKKTITNKVIGSFVKEQMQGKSLIQYKGERRLQNIASHITGNKHIDSSTGRQIESVASKLSLQPKVFYPLGKNEDFVFLGAAGSGKSTIAKQLLPHTNKSNYIVISTDNYRAVTMPGTEAHEQIETKDVLTRTQDMAYMVKELVYDEINTEIQKRARPNIICDGVTLEPKMKQLLAHGEGKVTSVVAVYSGEPGYTGIAERAFDRASAEHAAPGDKGRYVNTTTLFEGHATASASLLSSIPDGVVTKLYNTNVERGSPPVEIGYIDNNNNLIEIKDLKTTATFLNKRNINVEARSRVERIYNASKPENINLSTHPENKAKSVIDLAHEKPGKKAFTVVLKNKEGAEYARLTPDKNGSKLVVIDKVIFASKAMSDTIEGSLLRSITRQVTEGTLEKSLNAVLVQGDKESFTSSAKSIGIDIGSVINLSNAGRAEAAEIGKTISDFSPQNQGNIINNTSNNRRQNVLSNSTRRPSRSAL